MRAKIDEITQEKRPSNIKRLRQYMTTHRTIRKILDNEIILYLRGWLK
jgi:hypothetical protein